MKRLSSLAVALSLVVTSSPVAAQDYTPGQGASSVVIFGGLMSLAVVTSPVWLTVGAVHESQEKSNNRRERGARADGLKAGPLPPLTVEKIEPKANGAVDVSLRNPQAPQDLAVVQWPARDDNPAKTLKVGDVLDLTPTPTGAGWTVAGADGTAVAFLPTPDAAANNLSERW
ncbi:hypothetical protein [Stenotrophomonas sp. PD6]|jgi:hypothetical protein|uniref:hypothetical protein n=1 Tax=Stenotrophomonas sp. PD6 TaxID=3368612 RepID=UPI003BA251AD